MAPLPPAATGVDLPLAGILPDGPALVGLTPGAMTRGPDPGPLLIEGPTGRGVLGLVGRAIVPLLLLVLLPLATDVDTNITCSDILIN